MTVKVFAVSALKRRARGVVMVGDWLTVIVFDTARSAARIQCGQGGAGESQRVAAAAIVQRQTREGRQAAGRGHGEVPPSVLSPGLLVRATVSLPLKPVAQLPSASSAATVNPKLVPAPTVAGGCEIITKCVAPPGVTEIVPLVAADGAHRRVGGRNGLGAGHVQRGGDRGMAAGEGNGCEGRVAQAVGQCHRCC